MATNEANMRKGVWVKTHFYETGDYLESVTYLVVAGSPEVLRFRIDLRKLRELIIGQLHKVSGGTMTGPEMAAYCRELSEDADAKAVERCDRFRAKRREMMLAAKGSQGEVSGDRTMTGPEMAAYCRELPADAAAKAVERCDRFRAKRREMMAAQGAGPDQVSGFLGDIGKFVKKVGKSKILKHIAHGVKAVVRSKITGGIVASAAVVFPPVGVPAAGAYAAANVSLDIVDEAEKTKHAIKSASKEIKAFTTVKKAAKKMPREKVAKDLAKLPHRQRCMLEQGARKHAELEKHAPKVLKLITKADNVKAQIAVIARDAKRGDQQARAALKIFNVVARARLRMRATTQAHAHGVPGLFIDARGRIRKGRFRLDVRGRGSAGLLYSPTQNRKGSYVRVGCGLP